MFTNSYYFDDYISGCLDYCFLFIFSCISVRVLLIYCVGCDRVLPSSPFFFLFIPLMKLILSLCLISFWYLLKHCPGCHKQPWLVIALVSLFFHQFWMRNLLNITFLVVSCFQYLEYVISCFFSFRHDWQENWCYSAISAFVGELSFTLM